LYNGVNAVVRSPRFRLETKITGAAIAAIVIPEKGLFNMTVEEAAAVNTSGLSALQQVDF